MLVIEHLLMLSFCIHITLCKHDIFSKFFQNDYKVKDIRIEITGQNDKYMNHITAITYKYNRSTPAINGSFNFKIDNPQKKLQSLVQVYKHVSNEFREFPIHFQSELCAGLDNDALGLKNTLVKCGNFTECRFLKDTTYYFCEVVLDPSKLPPLIPTGRYKVDVSITYLEEFVFGYAIFGEAYRPFIGPKEKHGKKHS